MRKGEAGKQARVSSVLALQTAHRPTWHIERLGDCIADHRAVRELQVHIDQAPEAPQQYREIPGKGGGGGVDGEGPGLGLTYADGTPAEQNTAAAAATNRPRCIVR
jgi:hypothetical protein